MRATWGAVRERHAEKILLGLILAVGAALRWYGLAWDAGYLFHPDERQILMVASNLEWPRSIFDFFSPSSPLNPHFFAYGSFPIYLLRALAPFAPPINLTGPWANDFLARWALLGRAISGLFDLGTILVLYLLGRRLYGARVALMSAACLAVTVSHIQLAHFYTVDTLLTFFVVLTIYSAWRLGESGRGLTRINGDSFPVQNPSPFAFIHVPLGHWRIACGISLGLALATKASALPLIIPIALALWYASGEHLSQRGFRVKVATVWRTLRRPLLQIGGIALIVFFITQPYALIDGINYFNAVGREGLVARGWLDFPYTRQYGNTIPFLYQISQSAIWGMGLPLGILAWGGAALFLWQTARRRDWPAIFLLSWAGIYFLTIGIQYVKYPRYLLPLTPVLFLMACRAFTMIAKGERWAGRHSERSPFGESLADPTVYYESSWDFAKQRFPEGAPPRMTNTFGPGFVRLGLFVTLAFSLLYAISFVSLYSREHPWLVISRWIYENVRPGTTLAIEEWDDALPVQYKVAGVTRTGSEYPVEKLPIQDADDVAKLDRMARALTDANVVIVASQRGYGSVGRLAGRYPMTARYYEKLFKGELGYRFAATARNDPGLFGLQIADNPGKGLSFPVPSPPPADGSLLFNWGFADESLTVYDHPQPLIFVKTQDLSYSELVQALANGDK